MQNEINGYYSLALHPSQINIWYTSLSPRRPSINSMFDRDELAAGRKLIPTQFRSNSHNGKISKIAKKKITMAIKYLVYLSPKKDNRHPYYNRNSEFYINFVTLTLSSQQIHTDNEIKSLLLEPFLDTCRKKWKVTHYIWRAEKQENGSLHFHIITNRFIPWNELRNVWNAYQQKLGYITRYRLNQKAWHREGFKFRPELSQTWNYAAQLKAYKSGLLHDWNNCNSTDVHSLRHITNVASYFVKYLTKQDQSANIDGRLWGCSYNLSQLPGVRTYAEGTVSDETAELMKQPGVRVFKGDYFMVIYFPVFKLILLFCPQLHNLWIQYMLETQPVYYPPMLAA
jgi:hypothetical protein